MELVVHFQCKVLAKDIAVTKDKAVVALKAYINSILLHCDFTHKINYEKLSNWIIEFQQIFSTNDNYYSIEKFFQSCFRVTN